MAKDIENQMIANNIYITTVINEETTTDLLISLSQWVNALPVTNPLAKWAHNPNEPITDDTVYTLGSNSAHAKIYSPYEAIPQDKTVLNIYINSTGGNDRQTNGILTLLNIASARGVIIKTYNLDQAVSNASRIAVSGTHGYRYMAQNAVNIIHFGNSSSGNIQHADEIPYIKKPTERHLNNMYNSYTHNTKLTYEELKKFFNTEHSGWLNAKQCLAKGVCDWIITNDGRFINNIKDIKTR